MSWSDWKTKLSENKTFFNYNIGDGIYEHIHVSSYLFYKDKIKDLFEKEYLPDYIMHLTREEMPVLSIARNLGKKIPDNLGRDKIMPENYDMDTVIPLLTTYELLGAFAEFDIQIIEELKENGKTNYFDKVENKEISLDDMIGKKVIMICDELIMEVCHNINSLKDNDVLGYFDFEGYNEKERIKIKNDAKSYFNLKTIKKMVFLHELGHCLFHEINKNKNITNTKIKERQANFYASLAFVGKYDFLIKIYNNILIEEYHNPLLISDSYFMTDLEFKKEIYKLFGDRYV